MSQLVAVQLQHTNALLDKYVRILDKSEKITKLILDERWQGAEAVSAFPTLMINAVRHNAGYRIGRGTT